MKQGIHPFNTVDHLRLCLELDAFQICRPIPADDFVKHAGERGVDVNFEMLERLDELGLFRPMFYCIYPVRRYKKEPVEGSPNSHRQGALLAETDDWDGPTVEELVYPGFIFRNYMTWYDHGHLRPRSEFVPWDELMPIRERRLSGKGYYSIFQVADLYQLFLTMTLPDNAIWLFDLSNEELQERATTHRNWAKREMDRRQASSGRIPESSLLCQLISARYFPTTQSDGRTIQISGGDGCWEWQDYCTEWSAQDVFVRCQLTNEDVYRARDWWRSRVRSLDPLGEWYDLLRFISVDRRKRLKGHALLAQRLYEMEWMLRLFYEELTRETLQPPQKHPTWYLADGEPEEHIHGDPRYLRFIVNRYHLNPQVSLVLYVEGDGEYRVLPELCIQIFGFSFEGLGIEIRNLIGIPGFEGRKKQEYGALERAIEELHDRQILTFVILDNEGKRIHKLKKRLTGKPSHYHPERTFTRSEYLRIWDKNIEFDNFSNEEIASVLTETAGDTHYFTAGDVARARSEFGSNSDPLERLLQSKAGCGYGSKVEFLERLFQRIERSETTAYDKKDWRPVLVVLDSLITLASRNHQPKLQQTAEANQSSGFFGHPTEGTTDRVEDSLKDLRR